jgi:hypothetical protein
MQRAHIEVSKLFQANGYNVSIYSGKTELYNFVGQDVEELIAKAVVWAENQSLRVVFTMRPFDQAPNNVRV